MIFEWLVQIGLGILGGLLVYAALARRVWNLQCDLASTQAQLLKDRNSRAALIRHNDKASLELFQNLKPETSTPIRPNPLKKFGIGA
jgi:hypothetical protein